MTVETWPIPHGLPFHTLSRHGLTLCVGINKVCKLSNETGYVALDVATYENVHRMRALVRSDRRLTTRMIGEKLNLIHTIVYNELGMRKVCAKMVQKNLSQEQKDIRRERCLDFLESIENEPHFMERVINDDETWVFEYDLETKRQTTE
ncbi:hypothetical protein NQ318_014747 [Aromia moschata]|uniref:Uncharacterized protein n=1 Tax=Aromia moschata TaxID=1265417 RepID=A0AAV8ZB71_9CUCU|nr:hypothetical protein NQ318_014747 [Aromia moschata]